MFERKGPKFKIGDWVTAIGSIGGKLKMHIVGIVEDTCPAGTQVHYTLRTYILERNYEGGKDKFNWYPARIKDNADYVRYNECEVIAFKEEVV